MTAPDLPPDSKWREASAESDEVPECWCGHRCGHPWAHEANPLRAEASGWEGQ